MLDKDLFFGENARPTFFVVPGVMQFAFFPTLVAPNWWDLRAVMDLARANPVYANFRIATPFNNQADIVCRFAVFVDDNPTFSNVLTNPSLIIARSHDIFPVGMSAVGTMFQVAVPPLSDLARLADERGRQFLTLGMEALVPTADWVAGGVDAFLTRHALPTRPPSFPVRY